MGIAECVHASHRRKIYVCVAFSLSFLQFHILCFTYLFYLLYAECISLCREASRVISCHSYYNLPSDLGLACRMFALLFDLEDYATTYRATRDAYLKAANELKLATGPYKAARDAYVAATATYTKSLYE